MQKAFRPAHHVYDYVVVGSGLAGLCIANSLNKLTSNILLIEANETFGGFNRSVQTPIGFMDNGLRFLPNSDLAQKSVAFLELLLTTQLQPTPVDQTPVTFESSHLKPFVGFGENSPAYYDELFYFCSQQQLKTFLSPHEWTQVLFNNFTGDFSPRSFVTKINAQDGRVQSVLINGQKQIQGNNFIYCGSVKNLAPLLTEEIITPRAKQKMTKGPYWTAMCLDILHGREITNELNIHILNSTVADEIGPCVGQFQAATNLNDQVVQYSQWVSFIDDESAEDEESIGAALKKIKRQIKRVYPEALEKTKFERIAIQSGFSGNGDLKLTSQMTLPNLENLWIGSPQMNPSKNILGTLLQAEMIVSILGAHPMGVAVQTQSESPLT